MSWKTNVKTAIESHEKLGLISSKESHLLHHALSASDTEKQWDSLCIKTWDVVDPQKGAHGIIYKPNEFLITLVSLSQPDNIKTNKDQPLYTFKM